MWLRLLALSLGVLVLDAVAGGSEFGVNNYVGSGSGDDEYEIAEIRNDRLSEEASTTINSINSESSNNTKTKKIDVTPSTTATPFFTTTTTTAKVPITTANEVVSTTPTVSSTSSNNEANDKINIFSAFNLNYLYFLLLLIPIGSVPVAIIYCKRKKKKDNSEVLYRRKRLSTPSWVFSEPEFADEEVITFKDSSK